LVRKGQQNAQLGDNVGRKGRGEPQPEGNEQAFPLNRGETEEKVENPWNRFLKTIGMWPG